MSNASSMATALVNNIGIISRNNSALASMISSSETRTPAQAKELRLLREALALRRRHCHPLSALVYEAECASLTCALAVGELPMALECCRRAVAFLEMALDHVPSHPLLALQRFTLADLELACASATDDTSTTASPCVECVIGDGGEDGKQGKDGRARAGEL